jgi:hypothetical protein
MLEELPKHVKYHPGDTIVTSGYSAVFPPGIIVGTIQGPAHGSASDSFVSLRIKLTTNFSQLSSVRVFTNSIKEQMVALRRAEQGIDTVAGIQTRPEIKPEIVDVVPQEEKPKKQRKRLSSVEDIPCPVCGKGHLVKGKTAFGCSEYKNGCHTVLPFSEYAADLTPAQLSRLVRKNFKSK